MRPEKVFYSQCVAFLELLIFYSKIIFLQLTREAAADTLPFPLIFPSNLNIKIVLFTISSPSAAQHLFSISRFKRFTFDSFCELKLSLELL